MNILYNYARETIAFGLFSPTINCFRQVVVVILCFVTTVQVSGLQTLATKGKAFPQPTLEESDFGSEQMNIKAEAYQAIKLDCSELSIDPADIINARDQWVSNTWDGFVQNQCLLLRALTIADPDDWPHLWCSSMVQTGTVYRQVESAAHYIVFHGSKFLLRCIELEQSDEWVNGFWLNTGLFL